MNRDLDALHPAVRPMLEAHMGAATSHGLRTMVIETYRDEALQAEHWAQGRNLAGEIIDASRVVTYSRPGQSWHGVTYPQTGKPCSLAYHLAIVVPGGLLGFGPSRMDTAAEEMYGALATLGEQIGLTAGARWKMRDWTHYEYHPDGATLMQVKAAMAAQGDIHRMVRT